MPEISVIIPVYNVEKYIDKCVESVIAQEFKDLEIILVDDGSKDRSGIICDEYKEKDSRVKVIHKQNGGLSDARNAGIEIATGRYIGFVDSDDYIMPDMYQKLYNAITMYDVELACCSYIDEYQDKKKHNGNGNKPFIVNNRELYISCLTGKNGMAVGVWCKLYKKDLFQEIRFKKGLLVEDYYFLPELVLKVKQAVICPFEGYVYIHRTNSISTSVNGVNKQIHDRMEGCQHNRDLMGKSTLDVMEYVEEMYLIKLFVCYRLAIQTTESIDAKFVPETECYLRENKFKILFGRVSNIYVKMTFLGWLLFPKMYFKLLSALREKKLVTKKNS